MKPPGSETRLIYRGADCGVAVFQDDSRILVSYDISLWREFQDGHPFSSWFTGRVWNLTDPFFTHRSLGKKFVLELQDGKRLSLFIIKDDGTVGHPPGIAEGFPGLR